MFNKIFLIKQKNEERESKPESILAKSKQTNKKKLNSFQIDLNNKNKKNFTPNFASITLHRDCGIKSFQTLQRTVFTNKFLSVS